MTVIVMMIIIIIMTEIITTQPVLRRQVQTLRIYYTALRSICYQLLNGACHSNKTPCTILTGLLMTFITYKVIHLGVFMARMIQISILWVITPCSLIDCYKQSGGKYCRHHHLSVLRMETVCSSQTVIPIYHEAKVYEP